MFFVGIDIAKRSHEAVITDSEGKIVQKSFKFANSCAGYNKLLECIRRFTTHRNQIVFGMEATGHYWLALYTRLTKEGYQVHVINPLQSDALRNLYIRQNKTDAHDAFLIAEVIRFGRFSETKVPQEKAFAFRELCRNRFYMVDTVSDIKRKVSALLDQVFPEYSKIFSRVFIACSIEILSKYATPENISKARLDILSSLIIRSSNGYFGKAKLRKRLETRLELRTPAVFTLI